MSFCSSPASQRSSFSSTYSADCASPNTAVTTPSSSGATSPKLGQSYTYTQSSSPDALDFSPYNPTSPIPMNEYPPSSASPSYAYSYSNQIPSPSPYTYNTTPPPLPASPSNYGYLGYTNYMPESPPLLPSSYIHHLRSHTPPPPPMESSSSSGSMGGGGGVAPAPRKYSGYPPASAFYGPMPNSPTHSASSSSSSSRYRRKHSQPINLEEYKPEPWYTADGTKVEYSAMHLQCATM